jgi:hypothetical protein
MHQIAVLALDDVVAFELGIPRQIFGSAGAINERAVRCTRCGCARWTARR